MLRPTFATRIDDEKTSILPYETPKNYSAGVVGTGLFLPDRVLDNSEIAQLVDTTDEWIRSRTGIGERRIAAPHETTAILAEHAARNALENAQLDASDIDLIIVATSTPDAPFPSTASQVQHALGASCGAFDLSAACAGFTYALATGAQFVQSGVCRNVLVIGADVLSRVTDWTDRNTCVLFGDGAGAVVVGRVPNGYGLLGVDLGSDGSGAALLKIERFAPQYEKETPLGEQKQDRRIYQNGREVYKFAVHVMGESAARAVEKSGLQPENVDLLVPHQANVRIIESAAQRLGLPMERVFVNLQKYGNTDAATIPIALCEAREQNRIKRDDVVVLVGFGGGLAWSSCVLKWF